MPLESQIVPSEHSNMELLRTRESKIVQNHISETNLIPRY